MRQLELRENVQTKTGNPEYGIIASVFLNDRNEVAYVVRDSNNRSYYHTRDNLTGELD